MLHWFILIGLIVVMPFLLGLAPVKYMNGLQRTPMMAYISGWFVSFAVFEIVAVPFILLEKSFTVLVWVYSIVILVMVILSVWQGKEMLGLFLKNTHKIKYWKTSEKIGWLIVLILTGAQMLAAVSLEYYDGDDAYYIATAVMTDTFDTMYLRDNYTGYIYPLDARHALSPTPIYQAWLSRLSGIHPAAIAHSALGAVWLVFMYGIYSQIANRLFPKKKEYRPLFMIFLCIWFVFGNISLYTAETFAMTRTWQGKGLMAGMIIPALFLCFLYMSDTKIYRGIWWLFISVIISSVFATSISFMLVPTIVGVAAIFIALNKKDFKLFIQMCLCAMPCLVLGAVYFIVR